MNYFIHLEDINGKQFFLLLMLDSFDVILVGSLMMQIIAHSECSLLLRYNNKFLFQTYSNSLKTIPVSNARLVYE
jgi:hypothetical protein